jgi:hypothetical protein
LKVARVLPHDAKALVLGYLVDPHVRCHAFGWRQRSAAGTADCGNQEPNEGWFRRVALWTNVRKRTMRAIGAQNEELPPPW